MKWLVSNRILLPDKWWSTYDNFTRTAQWEQEESPATGQKRARYQWEEEKMDPSVPECTTGTAFRFTSHSWCHIKSWRSCDITTVAFCKRLLHTICSDSLALPNCHDSFRACILFAGVLDEKIKTPPQEIVCYCLGDLNDETVRFQLAFLLLVSNHFAIPPSGRLVYDPIHTSIDRQILNTCGCTPLLFNENAERRVVVRTLFYMPFAPFNLTENVVRTNFEALEQIYIIGNNFDFVWRLPSSRHITNAQKQSQKFEIDATEGTIPTRAPSVHAALKMADETVLWDSDHYTWQSETSKEARMLKYCLNSTLVTFPNTNGTDVQKAQNKSIPRSKL